MKEIDKPKAQSRLDRTNTGFSWVNSNKVRLRNKHGNAMNWISDEMFIIALEMQMCIPSQ